MKKFTNILMLILILSSGGYYFSKPKVSEEQAKTIVVKYHSRNMGEVKVTSISHRDNRYVKSGRIRKIVRAAQIILTIKMEKSRRAKYQYVKLSSI